MSPGSSGSPYAGCRGAAEAVSGVDAGYGKLTVLHGISIEAEAGEVVSILGPKGVGKSTLMKTIAGHLPVTTGMVTLNSKRIDNKGPIRLRSAELVTYDKTTTYSAI